MDQTPPAAAVIVPPTGCAEPYPDPHLPGCWRVPLASGKHPGMTALIDAESLPLVEGKRWNWSPGKPGLQSMGSVIPCIPGTHKPSLGRIILGIEDPQQLVAHVNGDRLDCRRANLVVRTRSESARLRKPSQETLSRLRPYPDPERPGVWRVPLKSHKAHREVLIDEADLPIVEGRNWNWSTRSDDDGRMAGRVVLATTGRQAPLHRMIANVTDPKTRVWFVNGDALDCRRANLAVRTLAEVAQASRPAETRAGKARTSSFKGISRDTERGKWIVQIRKDKTYLNVGRFDDEIVAAETYDDCARVLFGEHAYVNFSDRVSSAQAMADARRAMDSASNRKRSARRRQRDMERQLRRAAAEPKQLDETAGEEKSVIPDDTARQLFDVTPSVWKRWQRLGWLSSRIMDGEGEIMHRLAGIERLLLRCGLVVLPYPDPQRAGAYRVPLAGETAQGREALINADAVPLVRTRRWRFAPHDGGRGGEVQTMHPSENIRLHYVVMGLSGSDEQHIGHRNDDPLDCRRENLVVRTLTDTHANHRKQATFCGRPCTSRFKGVWWEKRRGYWVATIKKDRVQRRLGSFHDEIAAAQAYDEAAREWFGEHARLNFPDGVDTWLEKEAARQEQREAA